MVIDLRNTRPITSKNIPELKKLYPYPPPRTPGRSPSGKQMPDFSGINIPKPGPVPPVYNMPGVKTYWAHTYDNSQILRKGSPQWDSAYRNAQFNLHELKRAGYVPRTAQVGVMSTGGKTYFYIYERTGMPARR